MRLFTVTSARSPTTSCTYQLVRAEAFVTWITPAERLKPFAATLLI